MRLAVGVALIGAVALAAACGGDAEAPEVAGGAGGAAGSVGAAGGLGGIVGMGAAAGTGGADGSGVAGSSGTAGAGGGSTDGGLDASGGTAGSAATGGAGGSAGTTEAGGGTPGVDAAPTDAQSDAAADACVPKPEICDGIDNDCDGVVDQGNPGAGPPCDTGKLGACAVGLTNCGNDGKIICTQTVWPDSSETCNGKDDDCNGTIDEGDPGSGAPCTTGNPGICATGIIHCVAGSLTCVQTLPPGPEICDGKDNNCNGQTDEGNPGGGASCSTGQPGVCASGKLTCAVGTVTCKPDASPSAEVCDGKDNDCNGQTDEGNPGGGGSCTTGKPGVCSAGTLACEGGAVVCKQNVSASAETCNGKDDDCDGVVDNGPVCVSGTGLCQSGACVPVMPPGCTKSIYGGHTYAYCAPGANWTQATLACASYGGYLTSITSAGENGFVKGLAQQGGIDTWMGLRRGSDCVWKWWNGEPVTFTDWGPGQPDGFCGQQECGQFWGGVGFAWDNEYCSWAQPFICEWDK